ncbi:hypothetical protein BDF21DRAFT_396825 [Thamnidium elegans]|nr:hypothetical protein BDF21DRAFT_396825 [Thamnidium elegans]
MFFNGLTSAQRVKPRKTRAYSKIFIFVLPGVGSCWSRVFVDLRFSCVVLQFLHSWYVLLKSSSNVTEVINFYLNAVCSRTLPFSIIDMISAQRVKPRKTRAYSKIFIFVLPGVGSCWSRVFVDLRFSCVGHVTNYSSASLKWLQVL